MEKTKGRALNIKIGHASEMLNSFVDDYWAQVLSHLFYRGDCREQPGLRGRSWAKVLISRIDFRGWALSKDFAAMVYNIDMRRCQMRGVYRHVVLNPNFKQHVDELRTIGPRDFVNATLAAGECNSIREALRKKQVDTKVKTLLRNMILVI